MAQPTFARFCSPRSRGVLAAVAIALVAACASMAPVAECHAEVTEEQIDQAIERAAKALLAKQFDNGLWSLEGEFVNSLRHYIGGVEVCSMLALSHAGVTVEEPKMARGLDALMRLPMRHTYCNGLRILVLTKMLPTLRREQAARVRKVIASDVRFLVEQQRPNGAWGYPVYVADSNPPRVHPADNWTDFSNTQIAILGLSEAARIGFEIPQIVWQKAQMAYLEAQFPDGGWDYGQHLKDQPERNRPYGSMTASAVASLFLTRQWLNPNLGCPCRNGRSSGHVERVDKAIDDGLAWLAKHFSASNHPGVAKAKKGKKSELDGVLFYWLYACQRAGLASGIRYFGEHDWYAEGAETVLRYRQNDGLWGHFRNDGWAVCFLVKGRSPILFSKLQFEGTWNAHPLGVPNLVRHVESLRERTFQWQVINPAVPVERWHDSPVLIIAAESALDLDEDACKKLRRYTDTGGTILFEASCGNREARASWESLCEELWPEFELRRIGREHELWSADQEIRGRLPVLFGMNDGLREFMFVSWGGLACDWNQLFNRRYRPSLDLGINLVTYATDRLPLGARRDALRVAMEGRYGKSALKAGPKASPSIARVRHGGDWNAGMSYRLLERAGAAVGKLCDLKLKIAEPADASALDAGKIDVAYLAGRRGLSLGEAPRAALKAYLAAGGFLLAEALMGDPAFDEAFRAAAADMGLELKPLTERTPLVSGDMPGDVAGFKLDAVGYTPALLKQRVGRMKVELIELTLDGKPVGVYSPFDLSYCQTGMRAYGCRGYAAADARAILTNILLSVSAR